MFSRTTAISKAIAGIGISAIFFYMIEVFIGDFLNNNVKNNSDLLSIVLSVGYFLGIVIAMIVNSALWKRLSFFANVYAIIISYMLTIFIHFTITLIYLMYTANNIEFSFRLIMILKVIQVGSLYMFDNITFMWITGMALFTIVYTNIAYSFYILKHSGVSKHYKDDYGNIKVREESILKDKYATKIYQITNFILKTVIFVSIYYPLIHPLPQTILKFGYIFILSLVGGILSAWGAYTVYKVVGRKKYKHINRRSPTIYLRNFLSILLSSVGTFFFIYSFLMEKADTILKFILFFSAYKFVIQCLSEYLTIIILNKPRISKK